MDTVNRFFSYFDLSKLYHLLLPSVYEISIFSFFLASSVLIYFLFKHFLIKLVHAIVSKTRRQWDDYFIDFH